MAFYMGPGLSQGAIKAILKKANKELKDKYLTKYVIWSMGRNHVFNRTSGRKFSIRYCYKSNSNHITGQKIFISAGEHDLAENIIHLVLAKIPGGPEGIKGFNHS